MKKNNLTLLLLCSLSTLVFADLACAKPNACPDPDKSEARLKGLVESVLPLDNPIAIEQWRQNDMLNFLTGAHYKSWCHDFAPRTSDIRTTGPITPGGKAGLAFGTHARVRVYYSKEVVTWLENDRQGEIPDGAMIVKEMHPYPEVVPEDGQSTGVPAGWTFMLRDRASSRLGWIWGLYYVPGNQTYNGLEYLTIQPGFSYCTACHSSTNTDQGTFAYLGNLENDNIASYVEAAPVFLPSDKPSSLAPPPMGGHGSYARYMWELREMMYAGRGRLPDPNTAPNSDLLALMREHIDLESVPGFDEIKRLPLNNLYDHRVQTGGKDSMFLSSDSCVGCHNAANLLNNVPPHGQIPDDKHKDVGFNYVNVTPYGEWQGSMMAMSARDPIFRAQYEWEIASLAKKEDKEYVAQFCYSCHAVMGERTNKELAKDPANTYLFPDIGETKDYPPEDIEKFQFAALARDGVSCTACHHIADKDLGTEKTFTGKFETGDADVIYGPFRDVKSHPMKQALGLTPEHGPQMRKAGLCGSCHAVKVPVFKQGKQIRHTYEQTTFMEWSDSDYSKKGGETCQECHMPRVNPANPKENLNIAIANIEDSTFPYVPNRLNSESVDIPRRPDYRRHTLVAANVFGIAMFQQFPYILGSHLFWPGQDLDVTFSKVLSMDETIKQARTESANVTIKKVRDKGDYVEVDVRVDNLAGHKLPSGVGFRRAFIELSAVNLEGESVWCSGCTNNLGVIVDRDQNALPSEFTKDPGAMQVDRNLITAENEVQIYEHRATNCEGELTTSFIRLCDEVKDNRLLPEGWPGNREFIEHTKPVGLAGKPTAGYDAVTYRIPKAAIGTAVRFRAVLNYQSIPPYYLVDRFSLLADGKEHPETERLFYMTMHLNTGDGTSMKNWKVPMSCYQQWLAPIPGMETVDGACTLPL